MASQTFFWLCYISGWRQEFHTDEKMVATLSSPVWSAPIKSCLFPRASSSVVQWTPARRELLILCYVQTPFLPLPPVHAPHAAVVAPAAILIRNRSWPCCYFSLLLLNTISPSIFFSHEMLSSSLDSILR